MIKISVVIPIFNHARTLPVCLSTVFLQTREQPLEVIIVNDGSTDNFHETLNKFLADNSDFKALNPKIINQENLGAPAARNRGLKEAVGDYVIFVDSDTVCYPRMFAKMREALEKNLDASFAYSQFCFGWKKMKSHIFDVELLKKINFIDTTSLIRAKDAIPFDENLKRFQDWDLWLTMLEQGKIGVFVPEVLYKKIVDRGRGISSWLPSWFYRLPWKTQKVLNYEQAREIILIKHEQ